MLDAIHGPEISSPYVAPPPERPFLEEVSRDPGRLRICFTDRSPYGDKIDPEIAAATREVAGLLSKLGHDVEERAPPLASDPAAVMATIVAANTALTVRLSEQRFGREMTENDFERLTLANARNAQKASATDYVAAQLGAFQISRALATFFESCDVFLCPTLCSPPLRIGELNTMLKDLSHIGPILRRYMPATSMFNMSGQPAMSVPLAWNAAGLPLGMMFAARFGDEATLLRLAAQLEQVRPWKRRRHREDERAESGDHDARDVDPRRARQRGPGGIPGRGHGRSQITVPQLGSSQLVVVLTRTPAWAVCAATRARTSARVAVSIRRQRRTGDIRSNSSQLTGPAPPPDDGPLTVVVGR